MCFGLNLAKRRANKKNRNTSNFSFQRGDSHYKKNNAMCNNSTCLSTKYFPVLITFHD